jgi:hypothetical protein
MRRHACIMDGDSGVVLDHSRIMFRSSGVDFDACVAKDTARILRNARICRSDATNA